MQETHGGFTIPVFLLPTDQCRVLGAGDHQSSSESAKETEDQGRWREEERLGQVSYQSLLTLNSCYGLLQG